MYNVVQYNNDKTEKYIRMHGYFTDYEKAVQYAVAKARESIPETPNLILGINGYDGCGVDTEYDVYPQNVKSLSRVMNIFQCVAFPRQMKDTKYDAFILDILSPSGKTAETTTVSDFLTIITDFGCNPNFGCNPKIRDNKELLQDTVSNQRNTLNALLVEEILDGNLVDYLCQDDIVAFVSNEAFVIVEMLKNEN
jgi:hypothetical protein